MADDTVRCSSFTFGGIQYNVSMSMQNSSHLMVQVEENLSADQWRNTFDANYIEDITFKTGNFKKFPVFVEMLESAITKASDALSLDLLTYADLELLKAQKAGTRMNTDPGTNSVVAAPSSKKYLIVTYTAEFDRVHYPLPLPYVGKPDPRLLQDTIRQLQHDIDILKQQNMKDFRQRELVTLRRDYELLVKEKDALEAEFRDYRRQTELMTDGDVASELRLLRGMVRSLEEELSSSQAKHQRLMTKRNKQCRLLIDELDEVQGRERSLKVRVKSLTNELALFRRKGSRAFPSVSAVSCRDVSRSLSRDRSTSRQSSLSRVRDSVNRSNNSSHNRSAEKNASRLSTVSARSRDRSSSFDRRKTATRGRPVAPRPTAYSRSRSRERSQTDEISQNLSHLRMMSPASGSRFMRFNPTAYKAEKDRQQKEVELKRQRDIRSRMSGSGDRSSDRGRRRTFHHETSWKQADDSGRRRQSSRSPSVGSIRSVASSIDSLSDFGLKSDSDVQRLKVEKVLKAGRRLLKTSDQWNGRHVVHDKAKKTKHKILSSTPEAAVRTRSALNHETDRLPGRADNMDERVNRSVELSEIDERLSRLQQFMKENLK